MKEFTIEFVTMSGKTLLKTVKAETIESACDQLEKKYKIAYFNDSMEGNKDDFINKYYVSH